MGHTGGASSPHICWIGQTGNQSVCHFFQHEDSCICITIPRSEGQVLQCNASPTVWDDVWLLTSQDATCCAEQDSSVPWSDTQSDSHTSGAWPLPMRDVRLPGGILETRHYRPSRLHAWRHWRWCWGRKGTACMQVILWWIVGDLHINMFLRPIGRNRSNTVNVNTGMYLIYDVTTIPDIPCLTGLSTISHRMSVLKH